MEDLKGKMDLYIEYKTIYNEKLSTINGRVIKDEEKLKEFINELLENSKKYELVRNEIINVYNNLGY